MNGYTIKILISTMIISISLSVFAADTSYKPLDEKTKYDTRMGCMGCHQGAANPLHDNKKTKSR